MSAYTVDGSAVNTRAGWKHTLQPGPVGAQREEGFPGDPNRYMVVGTERPPDLVIEGYLTGSSISNLNSTLQAWAAYRTHTSLHTVSINGDSYSNCYLMSIEPTGPLLPKGGSNVMRMVHFTWRQLQS